MVYGAALEKRSPVHLERGFESHPLRGEVLEWSNRHAWRACVGDLSTVGSNPTLSASLRQCYGWQVRFTVRMRLANSFGLTNLFALRWPGLHEIFTFAQYQPIRY